MKKFLHMEARLSRKIASENWKGDIATIDELIRCHRKADWYRRRECMEPIYEIVK